MKELFECERTADGIEVKAYHGDREEVMVPEMLEGIPVVKIGAYCFHNMRQLRKIKIPDGVTEIGSHCFYDCRNLKTVCLSDRVVSIEDGAFKNCQEVTDIWMNVLIYKTTCLHSLLEEMSQKLNIRMDYYENGTCVKSGKAVFPKYLLDYEDNVPARIINQVTYGSGVHYRQCLNEDGIDFRSYDQTFQVAKVNDTVETLYEIARNRLKYPYDLTSEARKHYVAYLNENLMEIVKLLLKSEESEELLFLGENGLLTEDNMDSIIDLAHDMEKTESVSVLLDYKNKHFRRKQKSFVL